VNILAFSRRFVPGRLERIKAVCTLLLSSVLQVLSPTKHFHSLLTLFTYLPRLRRRRWGYTTLRPVPKWECVKPAIRGSRIEADLQRAKEFVELVGGIEIGFEIAGAEPFAHFIQPACEQIERSGKKFLVGQDDIAPRRIRASGKP